MIDAHLHLQDEQLVGDADALIETCRGVGIRRQLVNGTRPDDWPACAALAESHPDQIQACFGLHPWYVNEAPEGWVDFLEEFLGHGGTAGVGEIGLDKWVRGHDLPRQREALVLQLGLAVVHGLPVTIHCLRAWGTLLEVLQGETLPDCGFLLHSYGGPAEMVDSFVALGGYFSVSGAFFHERKRGQLETFVHRVPSHRLLVETDAPDMGLPAGMERFGEPPVNHPANAVVIYERLASMLGETKTVVIDRVQANFERLFGGTS